MRTYRIDLACKGHAEQMKLKAFVTSAKSLSRLCTRVGDPAFLSNGMTSLHVPTGHL